MIERFFTQHEWNNIRFGDLGITLRPGEPASAEFYAAFYEALRRAYGTYDDLPLDWRQGKASTARELAARIPATQEVLSYGAGVGYIEHILMREWKFSRLHLWDFASTAAHFDVGLSTRYLNGSRFPNLSALSLDAIYLAQVLYALDRVASINLLARLRCALRSGGKIISLDTSVVPSENGLQISRFESVRRLPLSAKSTRLAGWMRSYFLSAREAERRRHEQGWGWHRDAESLTSIFRDAGLEVTEVTSGAGQCIITGQVS